MTRIVLQSRVGADGVLHVAVPMGPTEANRDVRVIVEEIPPVSVLPVLTQEGWQDFIDRIAGSWEGELERPAQAGLKSRDDLP